MPQESKLHGDPRGERGVGGKRLARIARRGEGDHDHAGLPIQHVGRIVLLAQKLTRLARDERVGEACDVVDA